MAELFGKKTGLCKGRGGSMHLAQASLGVLGTNGIVGDGVSIAAGAGLSVKLRKTNQVVVCFFGDGTLTTGAFHEGINLIAVHKLPVVLICENNYYATSIRLADALVYPDKVVDFVQRYGIPSISVDGNDVMAVYEIGKEAIERARCGDGSTFIECKTFRQAGHFEGDPDHYRKDGERTKGMELDPIARYGKKLIADGIITAGDLDRMTKEAQSYVEEAVEFAKESPWPDQSEVLIEY
jgi:pyruvate dehydrogenase E1 component alpha subunit